jgi:hypothetical protein
MQDEGFDVDAGLVEWVGKDWNFRLSLKTPDQVSLI